VTRSAAATCGPPWSHVADAEGLAISSSRAFKGAPDARAGHRARGARARAAPGRGRRARNLVQERNSGESRLNNTSRPQIEIHRR
jgi:hypothetical protein